MQVGDMVKVRSQAVVGLVLQISGKAVLLEELDTHNNKLFNIDQVFVLKRRFYLEEEINRAK
jgi:hypothetical protein